MNHRACLPLFSRFLLPLLAGVSLLLAGCSTAPPAGVTPVSAFDVQRYAGDWYEIARLDHRFERGLTHVRATYGLQGDGTVKVINRGYDPARGEWRVARGKARFLGDRTQGSLEVSFFGPFYGGYHVIALDQEGYRWSLVAGPDRDYLWILARDPRLDDAVRQQLLKKASELGFDVQKLIWVEQQAAVPAPPAGEP